MAKKLETIDEEAYFYTPPSDDDVRKYLNIDPTRCRHQYAHTRHCITCIEALFSLAMEELKAAKCDLELSS